MEKEYTPKIEEKKKTGEELLIEDLSVVLEDAKKGEFGDFTNEKYEAPKMALAEIFLTLRNNVINGKYD